MYRAEPIDGLSLNSINARLEEAAVDPQLQQPEQPEQDAEEASQDVQDEENDSIQDRDDYSSLPADFCSVSSHLGSERSSPAASIRSQSSEDLQNDPTPPPGNANGAPVAGPLRMSAQEAFQDLFHYTETHKATDFLVMSEGKEKNAINLFREEKKCNLL